MAIGKCRLRASAPFDQAILEVAYLAFGEAGATISEVIQKRWFLTHPRLCGLKSVESATEAHPFWGHAGTLAAAPFVEHFPF